MAGPQETIEQKCRLLARHAGAELHKVRFSGRRGFPDRMLCVCPNPGDTGSAIIVFVEFKRPNTRPSPHQEVVHSELRQQGLRVEVVDSTRRFEEILRDLKTNRSA